MSIDAVKATLDFQKMDLKELQENRLQLGDEIKMMAQIEGTDWSAENEARYDQFCADYDACKLVLDEKLQAETKQKERLSRQAEIDQYTESTSQKHLTMRTAAWRAETQEQVVAHAEKRKALCLQSWFLTDLGQPLTTEQRQACHDMRFDPNRKYMDVFLKRGDIFRGNNGFTTNGGSSYLTIDFESRWENHRKDLETRNLTTGASPDAGATIPEGFVRELDRAMLSFGGTRRVSRILTTTGDSPLPWPTTNDTANISAILAENTDAGASVDPAFAQVVFGAYKFSSKPVLVSAETLDDSAFNMSSVIASMLGERIGRGTAGYFATGTGTAQPQGIVNCTEGVEAASATAVTLDEVLELIHSVDPAYRSFSSVGYLFNDSTLLALRKLKDLEGRYYWQPGTVVGEPDRLFGFPYAIDQAIPSIASDAKAMIFGALEKFIIRDHAQVRFYRLEERYRVENDSTGFITFSRHDSRLVDSGTGPIKHLVMAT